MAASKDPQFDAYHKWLGIPKHLRPPTYYQLLGLSQGESDPEVIEEAAVRQSTHLRSYQIGPHAELCTKLLNEIGKAQQVLLNPQKKRDYDERLAKQADAPPPSQQIAAKPLVAAPLVANAFELVDDPAAISPGMPPRKPRPDSSPRQPALASTSRSAAVWIAVLGGGAAALLSIAGLLLWFWMSHESVENPPKIIAEVPEKKPKIDPPIEVPRPIEVVPKPVPKPDPKPPIEIPPIEIPPDSAPTLNRIGFMPTGTSMHFLVALPGARVLYGVPPALRIVNPLAKKSDAGLTVAPDSKGALGLAHPDGQSVIVATRGKRGAERIKIDGGIVTARYANSGLPRSLAQTPDGRLVVVGDDDGQVKIYDADSGIETQAAKGHLDAVTALAVSMDGNLLASVSQQTLNVWNLKTKTSVHSGQTPPTLRALAFSPTENRLVMADAKGLWGATMAELPVWQPIVVRDAFERIAFAPKDQLLVSTARNEFFAWQWPSLKLLGQWKSTAPMEGLAVAPDNRFAFVGEANGWLSVLNLDVAAVKPLPVKVTPPPFPALFGDWETKLPGPPELTRLIHVYRTPSDVWQIHYTYLDGGKVVGAARGQRAAFASGQLSFTLVHDQKPTPTWPDNIATTLRLEGVVLSETQGTGPGAVARTNPRFTYPPPQLTAAGNWNATLSDGYKVSLPVRRERVNLFTGTMTLTSPKGGTATTVLHSLRPIGGNNFAFDIEFSTPPETPWSLLTGGVLMPDGPPRMTVQLQIAGKPAIEFPLSRALMPPSVVATIFPIAKKAPVIPESAKAIPPSAEKVADALKTIHEQFAKDYLVAKKSAAERAALAEKLVRLAHDTSDDLTARYVLFTEGRDFAAQAGKWSLAVEALDSLRNEYVVDSAVQREAALQMLLKVALTKDTAQDAAQAALATVADCLASDRIELAQSLVALGVAAAGKSQTPSLIAQFKKHDQEMKAVVRDHERMVKGEATLKTMADDAAAHLDVGRYLALRKRDWERGLPHLVKGGAGDLADASRKDLANPQDLKAQQEAGDVWWNLAEKDAGWTKAALLERAGYWYRKAAGQAAGLTLTVLNDRIKIIDEAPSPFRTLEAAFTLTELRRFKGHTGAVTGFSIAPDGKRFFSGSLDNTIRSWDIANAKSLSTFNALSPVQSFSFSPSQRFLATVGKDVLRIWNVSTLKLVSSTPEAVMPGAFWSGPDYHFSTRAGGNYEHHNYLTRTGTGGANFPVPRARLSGVDGKSVFITLGDDVRLFRNVFNFVAAKKLDVPDATCAAFSEDGRWLFVGSTDKVVRQIDLSTDRVIATYEGLGGVPRALAASDNGRRIVAGGDDKLLHLWDIGTPKEIARSASQPASIAALAFTAESRNVLSGGNDGLIRLWNLPREKK
jgi:WD40 repeat protein